MSDRDLRIRVLLDAIDRITRPLRAVQRGAASAARGMGELREQQRSLNRALADVSRYDQQQRELVDLGLRLTAAQAKARQLRAEWVASAAPAQRLTRAWEEARREAERLERAQAELAGELRTTGDRMREAGVNTDRLADEEARLRREVDQTNDALGEQRRRLDQLAAAERRQAQARQSFSNAQQLATNTSVAGFSTMMAGRGALRPLVAAVGTAVTFESAMADANRVLNAAPPELARIGEAITDMSTRVPLAREGLMGIYADMARAGVPRAELMAATEQAAVMGVAFDQSAEDAGRAMGAWRAGMRLTTQQSRVLGDQINELGNRFGSRVAEVSEIVTRVGPVSNIAGAQAGETAALASTMNAAGVQAEVAATGVKNLLLRLNRGDSATRMQRNAFTRLGMDATRVARDMQTNAGPAILGVLQRIQRLPEHQRVSVLGQLFGEESVAPIGVLLNNLPGLTQQLQLVGDGAAYAGSMQREFASQNSTTANSLVLLKNQVVGTAGVIGQALLPDVKAFTAWVTRVAERTRQWAKQNPELVRLLGRIAAGVAVLMVALGALAIGVGALIGPIAFIRLAWVLATPAIRAAATAVGRMAMSLLNLPALLRSAGTALATLGRGILLLAVNPLTLKIALIAAAVLLVVALLRKYWPYITAFFSGVMDGLRQAFGPLMAELRPLAPVFEAIGSAIGSAIGWFMRLFEPVNATSEGLAEARGNGVSFGRVLGGAIQLVFGPLISLLRILAMVVRAWPQISAAASAAWETVKSATSTALRVAGAFISAWNPAALFVRAFSAVWTFFAGLGARFAQIGRDLMAGLARGITSGAQTVVDTVGSVVNRIPAIARRMLGIRSPSRVFAAIGRFTAQGLGLGIRREQPRTVASAQALAARVTSAGTPNPILYRHGGFADLPRLRAPREQQRPAPRIRALAEDMTGVAAARSVRYRPGGFADRIMRAYPHVTSANSMRRQPLAERMTMDLEMAVNRAADAREVLPIVDRLHPVDRADIDDSHRPQASLDYWRDRRSPGRSFRGYENIRARMGRQGAAAAAPINLGGIHITGAPGQSEAEIARLVGIEVERRLNSARAAERSSLPDTDWD